MNVVFFKSLIEDAKMIREKVFMEEQGFQNEFDDIDAKALHLVLYQNQQPIGCARMFEEADAMTFGRIAVLKEYRQLHLGSLILQQLEAKAKKLGFHKVQLSAQVRASDFYFKNGYMKEGEEYLDEYCPHIHMIKRI